MSLPAEPNFIVRRDDLRRRPKTPSAWTSLCKKALGRGHAVTFIWTNARRMRALNRVYRGKNAATNVLAFPLRQSYGEIFMLPAAVRKEAQAAGISFKRRATQLFIHALLHLAGWRHAAKKEAARMATEEKKLLEWYNTQ